MARAIEMLPPVEVQLAVKASLRELLSETRIIDIDFDIPDISDVDLENWSEGGEQYRGYSLEQLRKLTGYQPAIDFGHGPMLATQIDTLRELRPHTAEWQEQIQLGNGDRFENLTLRWHQMVHLLVCHDLLLQGLPMLNMDSVGLGKTIEACASIGYIEFGRQYWEKHGQWPGPHFSEHHHLSDNDRRS